MTQARGGIYVQLVGARTHRKRRCTDVELMWPSLLARAECIEEARVAWQVFLSQDGQEHWRCPCGKPITELFRTITITIE